MDTEVEDESTYNNTESEDLSKKVDQSMALGKNDKDSNTEATEKLNNLPGENTMKTEMVESEVETIFADAGMSVFVRNKMSKKHLKR